MKSKIINFLKTRPDASFVELCDNVEGFRGDKEMCLKANLVLWSGISEEGIYALTELIEAEKVSYKPVHVLSYFLDGDVMSYPIAKNIQDCSKPRWLPLVFNLTEEKEAVQPYYRGGCI